MALTGAACFSLLPLPTQARVESGTGDLLRQMDSLGVTVKEGTEADCKGAMGMISLAGRNNISINICFKGTPTASDHDTVRHEAWHLVQYCSMVSRGGGTRLPSFIQDRDEYIQFIHSNLSSDSIKRISSMYPQHQHVAEFEAFAAAKAFTATEISSILRKTCNGVIGLPKTIKAWESYINKDPYI